MRNILNCLKIRDKLIVVLFLAGIIPFSLLFTVLYRNSKKIIEDKITHHFRFIVLSTKNNLDNHFQDVNLRLNFIQQIERSTTMSLNEKHSIFLQARNSNSDFAGLFLVSPEGKIKIQVLDSDCDGKFLEKKLFSSFFQKKTSEKVIFSKPFFMKGLFVTLLFYPLLNSSDSLILLLDMTALWKSVSMIDLGESGQIYWISSQGERIYSISEAKKLKFFKGKKGNVFSGVFRDYRGLKVVGSVLWYPLLDCGVVVQQTAKVAYEPLREIRNLAGLFALLGIGLILGLSLFFSRHLVKPLYKVIKAAREIGEGNYEKKIVISEEDEIGFLAKTINSMAENIKKNFDKLSTLNRTANVLASNLDLKEALKTSLNLLLEVTKSDKGIIFLLGKDNRSVEIAVSHGIGNFKFIEGKKDFQIKEWLKLTGCSHCFSLTLKERLEGFFLLNPKIKDDEFLNTLMKQVSLAVGNARLFYEAITDGLTGLFAKRYFQIRLKNEIERAQRYKRALSLCMLDIDHFKKINDTYGHLHGDFILKKLAATIKNQVRAIDIVSRYGGEEFVIILPDAGLDEAEIATERIRMVVEKQEFKYENDIMKVTVSIGIFSKIVGVGISPEQMVKNADIALYRAKETGRNRICVTRKD